MLAGATQVIVIVAALFRLGVFLYKKLKNMHIALPLHKLSNYNGHTTSVCIEALDHENSLLIPLCSIKTHPFDLITDGKIKLQITRSPDIVASIMLVSTSWTIPS